MKRRRAPLPLPTETPTRRLTVPEVAKLLGWPSRRKTIYARLRRVEELTGVTLVRRGGGTNNPSWVAWTDLRKAGLIDDLGSAVRALRDERDTLVDDVRALTQVVADLVERVQALEHGEP